MIENEDYKSLKRDEKKQTLYMRYYKYANIWKKTTLIDCSAKRVIWFSSWYK